MKSKKTIGLYPGTFDPVTNGHIDLIKRALEIFDEVVVAVAHHSTEKKPLFSLKERTDLLGQATAGMAGVRVDDFDGLVVEYARKIGATAMIRGIRMLSDFEYEFQMALTNRKLAEDIETIFLMPHESYSYLSSRMIKEVASLKGDISAFVPGFVLQAMKKATSMKININQFKNKDSLVFAEEINPEDLDIDIGVMHFPDNIQVHAQAWKEDHDLTVQVHVEGMQDFTCSLCLAEFNNLFEKDFTLHYDIKGLESVVLDSDIREEIIMEHPIRVLCKPGCRGLCQFCGANLNEEKCDCQNTGND